MLLLYFSLYSIIAGTGTGSSASSGGGSNSNPSHHSSSQHSHPSQHHQFNNNANNSGGSGNFLPPPYPQQSRMRHSSSISSSSEFTSVSQQVPNIGGALATKKMPQTRSSHSPSCSGSDKEPDRVSSNTSLDVRKMSIGSKASSNKKGDEAAHLGVAPHLVQSRESFQIALDNPVPLYF